MVRLNLDLLHMYVLLQPENETKILYLAQTCKCNRTKRSACKIFCLISFSQNLVPLLFTPLPPFPISHQLSRQRMFFFTCFFYIFLLSFFIIVSMINTGKPPPPPPPPPSTTTSITVASRPLLIEKWDKKTYAQKYWNMTSRTYCYRAAWMRLRLNLNNSINSAGYPRPQWGSLQHSPYPPPPPLPSQILDPLLSQPEGKDGYFVRVFRFQLCF